MTTHPRVPVPVNSKCPREQGLAYVANMRDLAEVQDGGDDDAAEFHSQEVENICAGFARMSPGELNQVLAGVHDALLELLNASAPKSPGAASKIRAEDRARLAEHGFASAEADALGIIWEHPRFQRMLADTPRTMQDAGFGIASCLDAVMHRLDPDAADFYLGHGFTAHQAELVVSHDCASRNLQDRPFHELLDLVESDLPRQFLVDVLRVAMNPDETDAYIARYRNSCTQEETKEIVSEVAMLAGITGRDLGCPC